MTAVRTVTAEEWFAALHERYAPHTVPAEVVRVAEVLAEVRMPVKVNRHPDVADLSARVVDIAMQVIAQAGLETWTDSLELRGPRWKDPAAAGRLLDEFALVLASNVDTVTGISSDARPVVNRRKRDPSALPPEVAVEALNDDAEGDNLGYRDAEPRSRPQAVKATRTPEREADYRKALHDTTRQQLSANALLAGLVICQRCWKSGELYATQATVAEWMHLASTKSVRKAVAELEAAGFLTLIGDPLPRRAYHYRLTIPSD
ncbi:hypothetical protein [Pseudonocardia sp. DLS-67]